MKTLTVQDLAMFIGCDCIVHRKHGQDLVGKNTIELLNSFDRDIKSEYSSEWSIEGIKPILRPTSDLTQDEKFEMQDISGWVDYTHYLNIGLTDAQVFKYMISKHFDVFGWIPEGLAIDSTKVKE